jgi:hypothetical protein
MEVQDGDKFVWKIAVAGSCGRARVARAPSPANCVQQDGLQDVHRFRVRSRP